MVIPTSKRSCSNKRLRHRLRTLATLTSVTLFVAAVTLHFRHRHNKDVMALSGDVMFDRTLKMRTACASIPPQRQLSGVLNGLRVFYISEKYKLSYCRVAKSGSTFMTQLFMTLAGITPELHDYGDAGSMFEVPRDEVHAAFKRIGALSMNADDPRVHKTTSFLVARNPYSRLFSSYIDQVYLPNNWASAKYMVTQPQRKECGNDVTFGEFLSYVADSLLKNRIVDLHWAPIFTLCIPCNTNIDMVVQQETFAEDLDFVLKYAGVERDTRELVYRASKLNHTNMVIQSLIHTYVTKGHAANRGCISEIELARKIWTAFQIQGYIHDNLAFPEQELKNVIRDELELELINHITSALVRLPLSESERKKQRQRWKLKFWKQVAPDTLTKVQATYFEDFSLFGYDIDPNFM